MLNNNKKFSIRKRIKSFSFALNGLRNLFVNEHNARIHLAVGVCVIVFGIIFEIDTLEWLCIVFAIGLVILTELLNTALEKLADVVDSEKNSAIKQVKDYSAAAVLIAAIVSFVIGLFVFIPKII